MDLDFVIREAEEDPRRPPSAVNLTGWESVVFEVADDDEEAED